MTFANDKILDVNISNNMDIIYRKTWVEILLKFNRCKYRKEKAKISLIFQGNTVLLNKLFNRVLVIGFNHLE